MFPNFLHPASLTTSASAGSYKDAIFVHSHRLSSARSHALWWPSRSRSTPSTVLLFIPGNPGLSGFYTHYLQHVYERLSDPDYAILAHGLLGHTPGLTTPPHLFGLNAQIESVIEIIDSLVSEFGRNLNVILVGHSVGSWFCLQSLKQRPAVHRVFLLFPTISHIRNTPNGQRLSWLFRRPIRDIVSILSSVLAYIPTQTLLSKLFPDWPSSQLAVLQSFISCPQNVNASLTMANEEMETILDIDTDLFDSHKHKLWVFLAEKDDWVGENKNTILQTIGKELCSMQVVHGQYGIPHAFCIGHSEELAKQTLTWLEEARS